MLLGGGLLPMFSGGGGAGFVLDGIANVAAAYSLRRLSTAYGGAAVRVRRSSDSAEQDIGFDSSGEFDSAAFSSFVGGGTGFVSTWYDQSGNVRDATQPTMTAQPSVVLSGINGKPVLSFDNTDDGLAPAGLSLSQPYSIFLVGDATGTAYRRHIQSSTLNVVVAVRRGSNSVYIGSSVSHYNPGSHSIVSIRHASNTISVRFDGIDRTAVPSNSSNFGGVRIGFSAGFSPEAANGTIAEIVCLASAISTTDHNAIGADMATRYGLSWTQVA